MLRAMWRRALVWLVRGVYALVVIGLFVLSGYVGFSLFVRRGVTPVPNVVGLDLGQAARAVRRQRSRAAPPPGGGPFRRGGRRRGR